eukprot:SAG22_NODE_316_length_12517_cov_75.265180_2_plen_214_part_00
MGSSNCCARSLTLLSAPSAPSPSSGPSGPPASGFANSSFETIGSIFPGFASGSISPSTEACESITACALALRSLPPRSCRCPCRAHQSRGEWGPSGTATQNHQKRQGYPLGKNAKMAKNVPGSWPARLVRPPAGTLRLRVGEQQGDGLPSSVVTRAGLLLGRPDRAAARKRCDAETKGSHPCIWNRARGSHKAPCILPAALTMDEYQARLSSM